MGRTRYIDRGGTLLEDSPVENIVILVIEGAEKDSEQLAEVHVIRSLFEPQPSAVVQIHGKFCRITLERE